MFTRELSQHFICQRVFIICQFGIQTFRFLPNWSATKQIFYILPLIGIHSTQSICPQVRVFVDCRFVTRHLWVKINASANCKTAHLSMLTTIKTYIIILFIKSPHIVRSTLDLSRGENHCLLSKVTIKVHPIVSLALPFLTEFQRS